ncbi:MAG: cell division ATP-binding protein FtsE [Armatimonadetes bacterium]|nr:cell division ATP-binding protein FtsE [Armatimonadota bacterium]
MIEFRDVSVVYANGARALNHINLAIGKGEFVFLVGPTGTGKSTLLKLVYREVLPTEGTVCVGGQDITRLPGQRVPFLRRRIGVVFQDFRLLPQKTVYENVAYALHVIGTPYREIRKRVGAAVEMVGLGRKMDAFPGQLSGGEQQRASIARAIVNNPPILLADEPTGNLDPEMSQGIAQLLNDIHIRGTTVVVASHDAAVVNALRKRVVVLQHGEIIRDATGGGYGPDEPEIP